MIPRPPTPTLFPYTTLFRSERHHDRAADAGQRPVVGAAAAAEPYPVARHRQPGGDHQVGAGDGGRSEEHTSELQSLRHLVCRLLLEKKKTQASTLTHMHSIH